VLDGYRIVQRTIVRPDQELDIRPLYIGGVSTYSAGRSTAPQSGDGEDDASDRATALARSVGYPARVPSLRSRIAG
jgi:hypothetical protein